MFLLSCEFRKRHPLFSQPTYSKYYEKLALPAGTTKRNFGKVWVRPIFGQVAGPESVHLEHIQTVPTENGLLLPEEEGEAKHLWNTKNRDPAAPFIGCSRGEGCVGGCMSRGFRVLETK